MIVSFKMKLKEGFAGEYKKVSLATGQGLESEMKWVDLMHLFNVNSLVRF